MKVDTNKMFTCLSLPHQKRKHMEYHDPDYRDTLVRSSESKRRCESTIMNISPLLNSCEDGQKSAQHICYIISREFQYEIEFKLKQLEQITDRLDNATKVLDRLRCVLVADYYRKQNPTLTPKDLNSVRGDQILFDKESCGVQLELHPSLKQIIGKNKKTSEEILRSCPMRVAFQTTKKTISAKSQFIKNHEKLHRLTHKGGLMDPSKKKIATKFSKFHPIHNAKDQDVIPPTGFFSLTPATKPLNAARLNNKTRHLIVVGNTSKYIGGDVAEQDSWGEKNTHKWLIYVQAKDINVPLERFVKKVRFFLHSSYRPNDIVDIYTSPFQLARRGWGEFPVRIQIFFVESLQQKPIQFVHNLVLDKAMSGLQTLGAETLVEIWLRSDQFTSYGNSRHESSKDLFAKNESPPLSRTDRTDLEGYASLHSQKMEENLFKFSKYAEITSTTICAGKEKIPQNIDEPVTNKDNIDCKNEFTPIAAEMDNRQSTTPPNVCNICTDVGTFTSKVPHLAFETDLNRIPKEGQPSLITQTPVLQSSTDLHTVNTHEANLMHADIKPKDINTSLCSCLKLPDNNTIILNKAVPSHTQLEQSSATKQILQKKLAHIVDADGNVKYIQMFLATSSISKITPNTTSVPRKSGVAANQVNTQSVLQPCVRQDSKLISRTVELQVPKDANMVEVPIIKYPESNLKLHYSSLPKDLNFVNDKQSRNVVFLREGKVYIIDPMQIKLKQQQKKQISLLKPQVSLLKKDANLQTPIICDHDYLPAPIMQPIVGGNKFLNNEQFIRKDSSQQQPVTLTFPHSRMKPLLLNENFGFDISLQELEHQFFTQKFSDVRQAVEYLLRRLPLIAKSTVISHVVFPFLNNSLQYFNSLSVFKQKAYVWLRSKLIANILRAHKDLQKPDQPLQPSDELWTTREIITFASLHAYTPPIISLSPHLYDATHSLNKNKAWRGVTCFTDLIKRDLKNEDGIPYESITKNIRIYNWIKDISKTVSLHQVIVPQNQIVEILNIDHRPNCRLKQRVPKAFWDGNDTMYLSYPGNLSGVFELVAKICKDAGICLQHEELSFGVIHPLSQTLLSTCLRLFIEKLLRLTLGFKAHNLIEAITVDKNSRNYIVPQDIGKVISSLNEFDFLSNCYLGTSKSYGECVDNQ